MEDESHTLNYPLYAVGDQGNVTCMEMEADDKPAFAVCVFTKREVADIYVADTKLTGPLIPIPSGMAFRDFVRTFAPQVIGVAFDPAVVNGMVEGEFVTFAELHEKYLPEVGYEWNYPVYVLRQGKGEYAAVHGTTPDGKNVNCLIVCTDDDTADRYMTAETIVAKAEPLNNQKAFAAFLRTASAPAVIFDPVSATPGRFGKFCISREALLKRLEEQTLPG